VLPQQNVEIAQKAAMADGMNLAHYHHIMA
jgi:hypothetical protein